MVLLPGKQGVTEREVIQRITASLRIDPDSALNSLLLIELRWIEQTLSITIFSVTEGSELAGV